VDQIFRQVVQKNSKSSISPFLSTEFSYAVLHIIQYRPNVEYTSVA